jgi:hypothetical protein
MILLLPPLVTNIQVGVPLNSGMRLTMKQLIVITVADNRGSSSPELNGLDQPHCLHFAFRWRSRLGSAISLITKNSLEARRMADHDQIRSRSLLLSIAVSRHEAMTKAERLHLQHQVRVYSDGSMFEGGVGALSAGSRNPSPTTWAQSSSTLSTKPKLLVSSEPICSSSTPSLSPTSQPGHLP